MRIFEGLKDSVNEIERDLHEMGTKVWPETYQDQITADKPEFETKELQGYSYMITNPKYIREDFISLGGNEKYLDKEIEDRTDVSWLNPGNSYKERPEVWEPFIHNGKFSYTYNERLRKQLYPVIEQLDKNPNTRQAVMTIYDQHEDVKNLGGVARIPCSMHYQFLIRKRQDKRYLDIIYAMRSCDFYTHFIYDVALADGLRKYISWLLKLEQGHLTHFIGSLHFYKKDCKKEVF